MEEDLTDRAACFGLIPAAGHGARFGAGTPKQYLEVAGRTLLHHACAALARHPRIERVYVVLSPADDRFAGGVPEDFGDRLVPLHCGGPTRAASVRNGLIAARGEIDAGDWVLVHDAARPCLGTRELERLIAEVDEDPVGGLLALPLADTVKRDDGAGRVRTTEPRAGLWRALTPQMFRYGVLLEALARRGAGEITDEASAVERLGFAPRLVAGEATNIKVTWPADLALAAAILADLTPR